MASINVQDNITLSNEVLVSHEICILGFLVFLCVWFSSVRIWWLLRATREVSWVFAHCCQLGGGGNSIIRLKHEVQVPSGLFWYLRGRFLPAGGLFFTQRVVRLAAAAGGRAHRLPAPLLPAGARCPSRPQQTGFLITHAASARLGARRQKPAAGERWPLSSLGPR